MRSYSAGVRQKAKEASRSPGREASCQQRVLPAVVGQELTRFRRNIPAVALACKRELEQGAGVCPLRGSDQYSCPSGVQRSRRRREVAAFVDANVRNRSQSSASVRGVSDLHRTCRRDENGREMQNCRHFLRLVLQECQQSQGSGGSWSRNAELSSLLALPLERGEERGERRKERREERRERGKEREERRDRKEERREENGER